MKASTANIVVHHEEKMRNSKRRTGTHDLRSALLMQSEILSRAVARSACLVEAHLKRYHPSELNSCRVGALVDGNT
jgi:hypothetical protein